MRDSHLEPLAVDIAEACRLTGIGRSKLYELLSAGVISSAKVGKRRLVLVESLRRWLTDLARPSIRGVA